MARTQPIRRALASVLDRLVEDATWDVLGREARRRGAGPGRGAPSLRDAVGRDLESLLNTRRSPVLRREGLDEIDRSLVSYGLPDLSSVNLASDDAREEFRTIVEDAIRAFEPRFKTVSVQLKTGSEPGDRVLRIRIEGLLHAEPAPEAVAFDSFLEPVARSIDMEGGAQ